MDLGVHLPLMEFGEEGQSLARLQAAVDAARACDFAAVSANDHFFFATPWLDGPTGLAAVVDRTGEMTLATTIALAVLRGPVPMAKALVALDVLSEGRARRRRRARILEARLRRRRDSVRGAVEALRRDGDRAARPRRAGLAPRAASVPGGRDPAVDRKLGLRAPACAASPGSPTAGSHPRTTRRRRASRRLASSCRTGSRTRSRRCGPGSPRAAPRRIAC